MNSELRRIHGRRAKFNNYRLTAPTDLTQQTLRTMRPKHGMVENLIECCSFGMPTRGGNPTFQLWEENRQRQVRRLMRTGAMLAVEFPGAGPSVIPGTQISLSSLAMESKRPVTIIKLSAEMLGLLEGYGKHKVEEWIQRALNRQTDAAEGLLTKSKTPKQRAPFSSSSSSSASQESDSSSRCANVATCRKNS